MLKLSPEIAILSCVVVVLTGCGKQQQAAVTSPPSPIQQPVPSHSPGPVNAPAAGPMIYVVSDYPQTQTSVLLFTPGDQGAKGRIQGDTVSVDDAGNVYLRQNGFILVYPASYPDNGFVGPPVRSINVGVAVDMTASPSGEIYVSDGIGIAVYNPKATGNVTPDRYIQGVSHASDGSQTKIVPGLIAVDALGDLYVQDTVSNSIAVFKPADSGTVVPARTIAGAATLLNTPYIWGMTADRAGNLYVTALFAKAPAGQSNFGVLVFDPAANGDVAPTRYITTPSTVDMYPYFGNLGVAVDTTGAVYLSACFASGGQPAVFIFAPGANGPTIPSNILTLWNWEDAPVSRIAVH